MIGSYLDSGLRMIELQPFNPAPENNKLLTLNTSKCKLEVFFGSTRN